MNKASKEKAEVFSNLTSSPETSLRRQSWSKTIAGATAVVSGAGFISSLATGTEKQWWLVAPAAIIAATAAFIRKKTNALHAEQIADISYLIKETERCCGLLLTRAILGECPLAKKALENHEIESSYKLRTG